MPGRKTRHVDAKEYCRLLQHLHEEDSTHSAGRRNFVFVLRRLQEELFTRSTNSRLPVSHPSTASAKGLARDSATQLLTNLR